MTDPLKYDVTIVGAGVAGCYVAYRLLNGDIDPNSALGQLKAKNGGKLAVGLFEYSGRVGGRLLSVQLPEAPAADDLDPDYLRYTEFGGFRFQPQMHIVRDLVDKELGLTHQPFPVDEPGNNPVLLRGKRFQKGGLEAAATEAYELTKFELEVVRGKYAYYGTPDLDTYVANQAFAGVLPDTAVTLPGGAPAELKNNGWFCLQQQYANAFYNEDWAAVSRFQKQYEAAKQKAVFNGRRFIDWPWWGLRSALLSSEAIAFGEDSGGYNSLYSSGNGPQGIIENFYFSGQVTDDNYKKVGRTVYRSVCFPNSPKPPASSTTPDPLNCTNTVWKHVSEGYSAIPNELYNGFIAKGGNIPSGAPGSTHLDHRNRQLLSFTKVNGGYRLVFFKRESNQAVTTAQALAHIERDSTTSELVTTKNLILALPKHSLDLLVQDNFYFTNPTVQTLLNTVIRIPAQRLFMAYPNPWWKDVASKPECGRSTTDLPVRQFYYWLSSNKENGPSVVLASYTNGLAEQYWRGLQSATDETYDSLPGSRPLSELAKPYTTDKLAYANAQGRGPRAATEAMAELAHRQLAQVVGMPNAPKPIYAHYQDWSVAPWGAGWHAWKAGANDDEVIPQVMQALPDEQVYICGEAYSNVQGWVQGALNTSETLLQTRLGLAWPKWLQQGGTWLGPGSNS